MLRGGQAGKLNTFSRDLGIFSTNGVAVWIHLTECYYQLEKYPTAEKCMKQILLQLDTYLEERLNSQDLSSSFDKSEKDGSLISQIIDILMPFSDLGFLGEDVKLCTEKIIRCFRTSHPDESL
jgi:hypothetical protein